ncbi:MAG TPA: NUDIX hydrolase [Bradyrhizobium sp.]|nr:NUDIX hydrolase [Bradyrhizobium sp.]
MTDTAQAQQAAAREEKEADHHPYYRPKDAATLILVDRTGATPKVLVGKRHDKVVFMPGKFVFPGGRVDKNDNRVPVAAPMSKELEANLLKGSPKINTARAKSLAIAAIREACEETGLCLGRKADGTAPKLDGAWKPFADAGLLPDPSGLFLIARAITPPGRVRRFDTRFFTADASAITHRVEGVVHADAELVELVWVELGSQPLADLHPMTRNVLGELQKRLATGPLRHDADVPFFHFYGGRMQRDVLGGVTN